MQQKGVGDFFLKMFLNDLAQLCLDGGKTISNHSCIIEPPV